MQNKFFQQFLSSGFGELNKNAKKHLLELYRHNYKEFLPKNKEANILEVGCGQGYFLDFLGERGYQNILGVDLSREAIEFCLERGLSKVKLINDLQEFLNTSQMYDFVVLNDVIEHFPKQEVLTNLEKIREKMNIGGTIIIKTGNMSSLAGLKIRYNDFTHETGFTEFSLSQVLNVGGFSDIMIYPFVFPKNRIVRIIRTAGQSVLHVLWKTIFFFEFTLPPRLVHELIFGVAKK
jgi:SAM-dependent methyltransferase